MATVREDEELTAMVVKYAMDRTVLADELELDPDEEIGDFPYVGKDLPAVELIEVGVELAAEARGRDIWLVNDDVGLRFFFGSLEEVKERVRELQKVLDVLDTHAA